MSKKGGYRIIDLKEVPLTSASDFTFIKNDILKNNNKVVLVSGVMYNNKKEADVFVKVVDNRINVYNHIIGVKSDGSMLFIPEVAVIATGEKFEGLFSKVYVRDGLCVVTLEGTPTEAVANGDVVMSGLPIPFNDSFYITLDTPVGGYSASLDSSGTLTIYYPTNTEAQRIDCTFVYAI